MYNNIHRPISAGECVHIKYAPAFWENTAPGGSKFKTNLFYENIK